MTHIYEVYKWQTQEVEESEKDKSPPADGVEQKRRNLRHYAVTDRPTQDRESTTFGSDVQLNSSTMSVELYDRSEPALPA